MSSQVNGSISPGLIQASAGALGVLFLASASGLVDVAGLIPQVDAAPVCGEPVPTRIEPSFTPVEPVKVVDVTTPVEPAPSPKICREPARTQVRGGTPQVDVVATLGHGALLRGGDGELYLHCGIDVADLEGSTVRRPIDLALVLDTSGSMAAALPLLKRATLGIVERLRPEDRLTIVSYSTGAEVVFQSGPEGIDAAGQAELERAVAGLLPEGGTNLSAGLEKAAEALGLGEFAGENVAEAGAARRILVLSDGKANQGITEPEALGRVVERFRDSGLALSSLGLGLAYDADLLTALADAGGGAYHYAADAQALTPVYAAEVDALQTVVAFDAKLTLDLPAGARVAEVYSWPSRQREGVTHVRLGDLSAGRSLKVVARLQVDAGAELDLREVVKVGLTHGVAADEAIALQSAELQSLEVVLSDDAEFVAGSEQADVVEDLRNVLVAKTVREARRQAAQGNVNEARDLLRSLDAVTGGSVQFEAADGTAYELDVDAFADEVAEGESSARGRAALKLGSVLERAAAR